MSSAEDLFATEVCKRRLAGLCAALGWNTMQRSSMDILVDLLRTYTVQIGRDMKDMAELCDRTRVTELDADVALRNGKVTAEVEDLKHYLALVRQGNVLSSEVVPKFPKETKTDLNFLKPGSREVLVRKVHINDYFPPMFPDMEDGAAEEQREDQEEKERREEREAAMQESKEENTQTGDTATGNHLQVREIQSVMMTQGGFISPAREGKLPESRSLPPHVLRQEPVMKKPAAPPPMHDDYGRQGASGSGQNAAKLSVFNKKAGKIQKAKDARAKKMEKQAAMREERAVAAAASSQAAYGAASAATAAHPEWDDSIESAIARGVKESEEIDNDQRQKQVVKQQLGPPPQQQLFGSPTAKIPKVPKVAKIPKFPAVTSAAAAAGAGAIKGTGATRGRKRKRDIGTIQAISKEIVPSSDSDSSPERKMTPVADPPRAAASPTPPPPPAIKVEPPKPVEEQRASSSNPLVPQGQQLYGFPSPGPSSAVKKEPDEEEKEEGEVDDSDEDDALPPPPVAATPTVVATTSTVVKKSKDKDKERDKDKISSKKNKLSKKKKDKHEKGSKKAAKKDKEKKKKNREGRGESSSITPSPSPSPVPSIKIEIKPPLPPAAVSKPEEKPIPKIKIKTEKKLPPRPMEPGLFDPSQASIVVRTETPASTSAAPLPVLKRKAIIKTPIIPRNPPPKEKRKERPMKKPAAAVATPTPGPASAKKAREKRPVPAAAGASTSAAAAAPAETLGIVTKTVGSFIDDEGNQVWFCPGCGKQDDGVMPMIGCDGCDDWYHWACVGITQDPGETQNWFCGNCTRRSQEQRRGKR